MASLYNDGNALYVSISPTETTSTQYASIGNY